MNSNWSYSPETVKLGCDLCDLNLWSLTLTFCMDLTLVRVDNFWKFHDDTMMETYQKRCDMRTDRQTDKRTENTIHRAARSQLKRNETNEKFVFCYVKLTNELSFKIRFPISGPTCRRQVLIYGTKHRDDNQLWGLQFHCRISLFRIQIWCKGSDGNVLNQIF